MAPELLNRQDDIPAMPNKATDMWAFGMVGYVRVIRCNLIINNNTALHRNYSAGRSLIPTTIMTSLSLWRYWKVNFRQNRKRDGQHTKIQQPEAMDDLRPLLEGTVCPTDGWSK